jgi:Na+/H+ antiporter NhaD/arsenite permease-like protein
LYEAGGSGKVLELLKHAIMLEYIPFIVLLFALYTISGGIRIEGDLAAHPLTNTTFIAIGGLLASFIGTTGAAMLLIRPLLETNRERKHVQHTVVFFIFVVCNCGGTLLPIGDPPLFMGYLRGVDFMWTMWELWQPWLVVNAILLAMYYVWDSFFAYPREAKRDIQRDETEIRPLRIRGLLPNALLLGGVIFAVALLDSSKPFPGTSWHPWIYLREAVQLGLVALSLLLGSSQVRRDNRFNYGAIIEVAALFIGIFICMQPAIEILHVKGPAMGLTQPWQLFWATGSLSSVLDNAPTYVVFFETVAAGFPTEPGFAKVVTTDPEAAALLAGISLGAVFMGAMTYIGNGPNFMVKAIAEQSGVKMPSFFGYVIRYSIPVLIPVFILITVIFLAS